MLLDRGQRIRQIRFFYQILKNPSERSSWTLRPKAFLPKDFHSATGIPLFFLEIQLSDFSFISTIGLYDFPPKS